MQLRLPLQPSGSPSSQFLVSSSLSRASRSRPGVAEACSVTPRAPHGPLLSRRVPAAAGEGEGHLQGPAWEPRGPRLEGRSWGNGKEWKAVSHSVMAVFIYLFMYFLLRRRCWRNERRAQEALRGGAGDSGAPSAHAGPPAQPAGTPSAAPRPGKPSLRAQARPPPSPGRAPSAPSAPCARLGPFPAALLPGCAAAPRAGAFSAESPPPAPLLAGPSAEHPLPRLLL